MKRIGSFLLTAALILSMSGCGGDSSSAPSSTSQTTSAPTDSSSQPSASVVTGEIANDYFTENGLTVLEEIPEEITVNGLVFNLADPQDQRPQASIFKPVCTVEPSEEEGYKNVNLILTIVVPADKETEEAMVASGVYDLYTGRMLPAKSTVGDEAYDYSATIEVDGVSYDISYNKALYWSWETYTDGSEVRVCRQVWGLKVPEDYDGLVYAAIDMISDPLEALYETEEEETEEIDESEYYAMDIAENEGRDLDYTVFFRFGNEEEA